MSNQEDEINSFFAGNNGEEEEHLYHLRTPDKGVPLPGAEIINNLTEAREHGDFELLKSAIDDAIPYLIGLPWGKESNAYDLDDPIILGQVYNIFCTTEGASHRPQNIYQLTNTIEAIFTVLPNDINDYKRDYTREKDLWFRKKRQSYRRQLTKQNQLRTHSKLTQKQIYDEAHNMALNEELVIQDWIPHEKELKRLATHYKTRMEMSTAHQWLTITSGSADEEIKAIRGGRVPRIDKTEWESYYRYDREWGRAVCNAEVTIERIINGEIPLEGIENAREMVMNRFPERQGFARFLNRVLQETKLQTTYTIEEETYIYEFQRMDVVLEAWRQLQIKGRMTALLWGVKDGKFAFGDPPITGTLDSDIQHSDKKRAAEVKWSAIDKLGNIIDLDRREVIKEEKNGKRTVIISYAKDPVAYEQHLYNNYILTQKYPTDGPRYISHSGHPLTIGRIGQLSPDYLNNTKIKKWKHNGIVYKDVTLYEILTIHGVNYADDNFPFFATELHNPDDRQEPPPGAMTGYDLKRFAANEFRKVVTQLSDRRNFSFAQFWSKDMRDAARKLGLIQLNSHKNGRPDNPLAWLLLSQLELYSNNRYYPQDELVHKGIVSSDFPYVLNLRPLTVDRVFLEPVYLSGRHYKDYQSPGGPQNFEAIMTQARNQFIISQPDYDYIFGYLFYGDTSKTVME